MTDVISHPEFNVSAVRNELPKAVNQTVNDLEFISGSNIVKNLGFADQPFDWKISQPSQIIYSPLDHLNRMGKGVAYLTKENLGKSEGRSAQRWNPTGWHNQNRNQDRGHGVAYTLSFNLDDNGNYQKGLEGSLDNPYNLFTQTSQSNRGAMQVYEEKVRDKLAEGVRVIYTFEPKFVGDELMARAIQLQAISEDGKLNFNVLIYNVADGYSFDYTTGRSVKDSQMIVND